MLEDLLVYTGADPKFLNRGGQSSSIVKLYFSCYTYTINILDLYNELA